MVSVACNVDDAHKFAGPCCKQANDDDDDDVDDDDDDDDDYDDVDDDAYHIP